jgi:hypothetical protein
LSVEVRPSDTQAGVLGFEIADAVFHPFNGRSDMGGIELFRDMLGAVHVPGLNREQDRLLRSRVVTFRQEPREQLRIVRDDASSTHILTRRRCA